MIDAAAQTQLRAMLLEPLIEPVLAPLSAELGDFGDLVTEALARSLAAGLPS